MPFWPTSNTSLIVEKKKKTDENATSIRLCLNCIITNNLGLWVSSKNLKKINFALKIVQRNNLFVDGVTLFLIFQRQISY